MNTNNPIQNWSEMREAVLILNVAVARIQHAMVEGDDSFTSLSKSFVEMINSSEQITLATKKLDDSPEKENININCQSISQRVSSSIIAFQFYDKLSQRMALVSKTLNSLTEILNDDNKINNHEEWLSLKNTIRSKYTLDADQEMFEAVLNGMAIEDALKIAVKQTSKNDIEFF